MVADSRKRSANVHLCYASCAMRYGIINCMVSCMSEVSNGFCLVLWQLQRGHRRNLFKFQVIALSPSHRFCQTPAMDNQRRENDFGLEAEDLYNKTRDVSLAGHLLHWKSRVWTVNQGFYKEDEIPLLNANPHLAFEEKKTCTEASVCCLVNCVLYIFDATRQVNVQDDASA